MRCEALYLVNFVILGMAGYFSAVVRSPITGVILITEMTGDFRNFFSLSVVALIAYLAADLRSASASDSGEGNGAGTRRRGAESQGASGKRRLHRKPDGETIDKILLPKSCLVVSVQRDKREIVPGGSTMLRGGNKLVLLCQQRDVSLVEEKRDNNICRIIKNRKIISLWG